MSNEEKQKHIDAFKYWCETNEECGVITIPKFVCDNIIEILDNAPTIEPNDCVLKEFGKCSYKETGCSDCKIKSNLRYMCHGSAWKELQALREFKEKHDKKGKWVKIFENPYTNGYVCPFCGHKIQVTEQFLTEVTECEACGADMRGNEI